MGYLKLFTNWRIVFLTVIYMAAFILIFSESENITAIIATKLIGFALGYTGYTLSKSWGDKGLIDEINVFSE